MTATIKSFKLMYRLMCVARNCRNMDARKVKQSYPLALRTRNSKSIFSKSTLVKIQRFFIGIFRTYFMKPTNSHVTSQHILTRNANSARNLLWSFEEIRFVSERFSKENSQFFPLWTKRPCPVKLWQWMFLIDLQVVLNWALIVPARAECWVSTARCEESCKVRNWQIASAWLLFVPASFKLAWFLTIKPERKCKLIESHSTEANRKSRASKTCEITRQFSGELSLLCCAVGIGCFGSLHQNTSRVKS